MHLQTQAVAQLTNPVTKRTTITLVF